MGALAIEAGATLGEAYRKLFLGWGVTLPAGESPDIGVGGHVLGGAFGFLCRQHGLAADHLYGDYLTRKYPEVAGGSLGLATYGGRVNTVAPDATASAQRESILTTSYGVGWARPEEEARSLTWLREFYQELFAETGGVPVPGEASNGALINHPDTDLADPSWNRSKVPWSTLHYKDNYARLQRVKARWDPRNVFHHRLSIRAEP